MHSMAIVPLSAALRQAVADNGGQLPDLVPLGGDGSDRQFFRLPNGARSLILLYQSHPPGRTVTENDSYFYIGRHLWQRGLPVPEIYHYCREEGWFLLEDLGDWNLQDEVQARPTPEAILAKYNEALKLLVRVQIEGHQGFDPAWCFDTPVYDHKLVRERECHYFVRAFLQGFLGMAITPEHLEADFGQLLAQALPAGKRFFLHRDFQSRNLMIKAGCLRLIDFQGSRLGPLAYDLAALLLDPYVALPLDWQERLLQDYLKLVKDYLPVDEGAFTEQYEYLAICRNLQILGAFSFLTRVKGKPQFAQYLPPALAGLRDRLAQPPGQAFPRLRQVVEQASEILRSGFGGPLAGTMV
ncbi:MAG: phosphotransferase [Desulfobacca sp.]|nr:phosphotransferase [Desulfobacca sp.]